MEYDFFIPLSLGIDTFDGLGNPWSITFSYPSRVELVLLIGFGTSWSMTFSYPSRLELILLMASGTLTDIIPEAYDASTAEVFTILQL